MAILPRFHKLHKLYEEIPITHIKICKYLGNPTVLEFHVLSNAIIKSLFTFVFVEAQRDYNELKTFSRQIPWTTVSSTNMLTTLPKIITQAKMAKIKTDQASVFSRCILVFKAHWWRDKITLQQIINQRPREFSLIRHYTLDGLPSQRLTNWVNFSSTIISSRPDT